MTGDGVIFSYSTALTGTSTSDVLSGKVYQMRVRAHNVHGWSEWSPVLHIKSTGIPDKGQAPTTAINNYNVKVAWTYPNDNFEPLDSYRILIAHSDYINYSEVILYCDGSNAVVFELLACQIPLSVLNAAPFNLIPGNEVVAKY